MQLIKICFALGLLALASAGHHHDHASSYSNLVKHDEHHGHQEHHDDSHGWDHMHNDGDHGHHGNDDHHDHHDHHSHPAYKFQYGVMDSHTGDNKNQWEHRDGDHVKGSYELHEADGTKRVVEYTSDKHGGLKAVVKRIGHAQHPQVYGHHEGHHGEHHEHGHGHAESWANSNLYDHHH